MFFEGDIQAKIPDIIVKENNLLLLPLWLTLHYAESIQLYFETTYYNG